jgi:hypothetical protein
MTEYMRNTYIMLIRYYEKRQFIRPRIRCEDYIVACLLGNATKNLWVLDLRLDLLGIRQAELQLIITLLILL